MTQHVPHIAETISFGPFALSASERLLTRDGIPVELGARTLDTLIALISHPNDVIGKRELMAEIWTDTIVEEGSLRFQIAGLRKALGDGIDGARYIATLAGRGYCFVAPITRSDEYGDRPAKAIIRLPSSNMPHRPVGLVGRADDVTALSAQLSAYRFITIVGTGGVGKTTVAVELGHDLADSFAGAVLFVDLGVLSDPDLVATTVASMLGLSIQSNDPTPGLVAFLRGKRILLILDTCEHLIDAVAALAARIFEAALDVYILATSREALQVDGEHIHRLAPLAYPPGDSAAMATVIHRFPATRLFIERAAASGAGLNLGDADAAIVADICRKLGGVALAIELAARRVEAYGLQQIAAHLDQSLALSWAGPRSAPPRQKTLQATLEWSYGLLSELERTVLRRLAIFVGDFTIEAALAVVTNETIDHGAVFGAVDSLVAKSMLATRPAGAMMRYRLLDTTRSYALGLSSVERTELAPRHAIYYSHWLNQTGAASRILSGRTERAGHFAALNNVRAALEWCFGDDGDVGIGVDLAAAAVPVFLAMSLLPECYRWSERALLEMDDAMCGGRAEMHFQAAIGVAVMFTRGGRETARVALHRSLAIAETVGDPFEELQVLGPLQLFYVRSGSGDFKTALHYARRYAAIADTLNDPVVMATARSLLGMSLHFAGEYDAARAELEAALRSAPRTQPTTTTYIGFECRILAGAVLARTLWLQGYPAQAMERVRQTVKEAAEADHSVSLCIALIWSTTILLWAGDFERAEEYINWLVSLAEENSLTPYLAVAHTFGAELAIRRGGGKGSIDRLQDGISELNAAPYGMLNTPFNIWLVEAFAAAGRFDEGRALLDDTFAQVEANGDACYAPELLRVKSLVLMASNPPDIDDAERCLVQSLEMSLHQGARIWELRAGIDLARLLAKRGQSEAAHSLLQPLVSQFDGCGETVDLKAAHCLLASIRS